jgi:hypothetical protein
MGSERNACKNEEKHVLLMIKLLQICQIAHSNV